MSKQTLKQHQFVKPAIQSQSHQKKYETDESRTISFYLYMLFLISYFLHLPARISFLGFIRFDLLLMTAIVFAIIANKPNKGNVTDRISTILYCLLLYIFVSLPFVEWPGSVLNKNIFIFIKALVFFFFTVNIIRTNKDMKTFMIVFISCQLFRVLEPTWLHITTGYWGSTTHMGGGEFLDRLSGGPYDIINPNGLAWVIVSIIPFMFFLTRGKSFKVKFLFYVSFLICIYALVLTESRSGMVGLAIIIAGIIWKSKAKILLIILTIVIAVIVYANLDPLSQDRYLSIFRKDVKGAQTAQGRIDSWSTELQSVLHRPIVGHGLGTSVEVGANILGYGQISHNLYIEVLQELGIIGFTIFVLYIINIFKSFLLIKKRILKASYDSDIFLVEMVNAMQVWIVLALIFSMASYGLSEYTWYLFGGISAVLLRLTETKQEEPISNVLSTE